MLSEVDGEDHNVACMQHWFVDDDAANLLGKRNFHRFTDCRILEQHDVSFCGKPLEMQQKKAKPETA